MGKDMRVGVITDQLRFAAVFAAPSKMKGGRIVNVFHICVSARACK